MRTPREAETRKSRKARTAPFQVTYDAFLLKLKAAREEAGLTQREVSERLGLSHTFLNKCETGERRVDVIELIQLAELYGRPPQFFLNPD
jgi:transcriptional regulator with XRE-family HTH domain